jgi:hypothetical protein
VPYEPVDHGGIDPADTSQRLTDDADAGGALGLRAQVHPPAPAATGPTVRARRHDPVRRRLQHVDGDGAGEVTLRRTHLGDDQLAGERAADEHDASVIVAGQRLPAGDEPLRTHGQPHAFSVRPVRARES